MASIFRSLLHTPKGKRQLSLRAVEERKTPILIKRLGQNFLYNKSVVERIVNSARITENDVVLEVGGGTGNLTLQLLPLASKVIVFEPDRRMIEELEVRAREM